MLASVRSFLRTILRKASVQHEIDEELHFHLEHQIEEFEQRGLTPAEARRRAHAMFGGFEAVRTETRQAHGTFGFESTLADIRYGIRMLRQRPGFTLVAVSTLALAIGAVATVLTLTHTFYRQTLPVPRADNVVEIVATRNEGTSDGLVSYQDYRHFSASVKTVRDLVAVYATAPLFVSFGDTAREINGAVVSARFFQMLGIRPALGRFFTADEDSVPLRNPVVVLGHDLWLGAFAGATDVIGRTLTLNRVDFEIVGVAPAGFQGVTVHPARVYMPTMMLPVGYRWCSVLENPDCTILRLFGRLVQSRSLEAAATEASAIIPPRWHDADTGENSGATVRLVRGTQPGEADHRLLRLLAWMTGLVLLVCCANLAGLLLVRSRGRHRELAIRIAVGASRARIVRQLMTEAWIIAAAGGVAGIACALGLTHALHRWFYAHDPVGRPLHVDLQLAPSVLLAVVVLTIVSGVLFGLFPALALVRRQATSGLGRRANSAATLWRTGRWLVAAQAASAVALVVVAALLVNSAFQILNGVNFDPSQVVLMRLRPRLVAYQPEQAQQYLRKVATALRATPGVTSLSMVGSGTALHGLTTEVSPDAQSQHRVRYLEITPDYFETLSIPLLSGRPFTDQDRHDTTAVALVSQTLAHTLWPGTSPLGQGILVDGTWRKVVGMAADVPLQSRAESPRLAVYVAFWQNMKLTDARLQIHVAGATNTMIPTLAAVANRIDPAVPVTQMVPMKSALAGELRPLRMGSAAAAFAGTLAMVLCAIGLYASLAAAVEHRTREIGVRLALGATKKIVLSMIAREGMAMVAAGIALGIVVALAAPRLLQHALYGSADGDGRLYLAAAVMLTFVGMVACLLPARRATRIEPMTALRLE